MIDTPALSNAQPTHRPRVDRIAIIRGRASNPPRICPTLPTLHQHGLTRKTARGLSTLPTLLAGKRGGVGKIGPPHPQRARAWQKGGLTE
jgi:hypothetical protein